MYIKSVHSIYIFGELHQPIIHKFGYSSNEWSLFYHCLEVRIVEAHLRPERHLSLHLRKICEVAVILEQMRHIAIMEVS